MLVSHFLLVSLHSLPKSAMPIRSRVLKRSGFSKSGAFSFLHLAGAAPFAPPSALDHCSELGHRVPERSYRSKCLNTITALRSEPADLSSENLGLRSGEPQRTTHPSRGLTLQTLQCNQLICSSESFAVSPVLMRSASARHK